MDDQVRNHPAPTFWLWDVTAALLIFELSGIAEAYKENRKLGNHILQLSMLNGSVTREATCTRWKAGLRHLIPKTSIPGRRRRAGFRFAGCCISLSPDAKAAIADLLAFTDHCV